MKATSSIIRCLRKAGGGAALFALAAALWAQSQSPKSLLGTVSGFRPEAAEVLVKPDAGGDPVAVKLSAETLVQRIAPGEKDLKKAEPISAGDVRSGDRVLVSFVPGLSEARRLIVMSSSDITRRNEADRRDWTARGVAGVVAAKKGNEVTLRVRGLQGETSPVVVISEKSLFRRYAPDSVRFADARTSSLAEVTVGDQLRARGVKSADGLRVEAEEVVFGTFLTKAGEITAVNTEAGEVTIKDLASNKPLVVKLTGESQLKRMPSFGGGFAPGGGGGPMGGGSGPGGPPAAGGPGGAPGGRPGGMMGPGGGGPRDLSQMIERMPAMAAADLKVGDTIVVSSTKGANANQVTAITLLANAGMLIQMAAMQQQQQQQQRGGGMGGSGGPGMMGGGGMGMGGGGGLGGLELPGMIP